MIEDYDTDLFPPRQSRLPEPPRLTCVMCGARFDPPDDAALCDLCRPQAATRSAEVVASAERLSREAFAACERLQRDDATVVRYDVFHAAEQANRADPRVVALREAVRSDKRDLLLDYLRAIETRDRLGLWYRSEIAWAARINGELAKIEGVIR